MDPGNPDLDQITFRNSTDKAIAILSLEGGITPFAFGKFMDVICSADFKVEELTLRSIPDIDRYISDQRRENASSRCALGKLSPSSSCGIPELVVDLLFQYVGQLIVPFGEMAKNHWNSVYLQRDAITLLKMLSLAHRNWTPYAQNLLRRRLVIRNHTKLRRYLQSPLLGPWVREVALSYTIGENLRFEHAILQDLFRRLPEIQSITVHLLEQDEDGGGQEVLACLTGFISQFSRFVKAIWLSDDPVGENDSRARYGDIFETLAGLSELRYLSISCEIDNIELLPLSVEVLEIQGNDKYIRYCVGALLKAKRPKSLRELSLDFSEHEKETPALPLPVSLVERGTALFSLERLFIKPGLARMTSSTYTNFCASMSKLMIDSLDMFVDYGFTINFPFPGCQNLRHLVLHFPFSWTPQTDETRLTGLAKRRYSSERESDLLQLIRSMPRLASLVVTNLSPSPMFISASIRYAANQLHSSGTEFPIPLLFAATARLCEERGIAFTCKVISYTTNSR